MSPKNVFICYRRDDAEGYAGRLYDRLNSRFPGRVFMDVTGISPGADFTRVIQETVGSCHVLLAIIGRHWTTATDTAKRRRLDLADDYVRHEIATALSRNITVIPILVRGAEMPSREVLPPDLAALSTRNALEISDVDFDHDARRLIDVLERVFGESRPLPPNAPPQASSGRNSCLIIGLITLLAGGALVACIFVIFLIASSNQNNNENVAQPSSTPQYLAAPSTDPTTEPQAAQQDDAEFHPVGRWIVTFEANGQPVRDELVLKENKTYQSGEETGSWDYSPSDGSLTLAGWLVITIEGRDGTAFVGHGHLGYSQFPIRLTPD